MLNWRRDPDYEQSIVLHEQRMLQYEQRRIQHEQRMKQLESETEQLRQENARGRQLLAKIDALCFPPESSSIPAIATEPGSKPSSP
jgi:cell division protein FtsB